MSIRAKLRKKVVLPVTVVRHDGEERQLAHTLDITDISARLGGLCCLLENGEIIELHRGGAKSKFQVIWMGAPGSAMAGQAGVRSMEPNKCLWSGLSSDEPDVAFDIKERKTTPTARTTSQFPGERRWHTRYQCEGSAAVKTKGCNYAISAEVKDVSTGGVYLELTTPLPVNTIVQLKINIEDTVFDAMGTVRTSYPMVGMGVSFQEVTLENQDKIVHIIEQIKRKASPASETPDQSAQLVAGKDPGLHSKLVLSNPNREADPAQIMIATCKKLASGLENWKKTHSQEELEALRNAVCELQDKLSPELCYPAGYMACKEPQHGVV
ncbi:MAG TPA: PilZ domain-containing protein [Alphaproteobacteria bacterium]|nr:PilZ domain-containing protein [Alphaproteobacteria bacterium]